MRFVTVTWVMLAVLCALVPLSAATAGSGKTIIVAIDPGHGGKDQGAVGPGGILEKDIALQIARRLAGLVNSQRGMRAVLTRDGDQFLHLQERIDLARRHKADVFVSIHADAFTNPESRGSSVFTLSTRGASSAAAQWLARRENAADSPGVAGLNIKDEVVRAVVFDMYHDAILAESMTLAGQVLAQLGGVGSLHTGMVERAGFAVLKAPDVPSILVEAAFISNPSEAARLRNGKQQQQLAQAILRGIRAYLNNQMPTYRPAQPIPAVEPRPAATVAIRAAVRSPDPAAPKKIPPVTTQRATRRDSQAVTTAGSKPKAVDLPSRARLKPSAKVVSKPQPAASAKPALVKARPAPAKSTKVAGGTRVTGPGKALAAVTE
ncbi:MAG: N-acetylmuramoyl-L-alanine amidase [Candidatus Competibacteraceae bacterium]